MPPFNKQRGDRYVKFRGVEGKLSVDIMRRREGRPDPAHRLGEYTEAVMVDESHTEPMVQRGAGLAPAVRVVESEAGLLRAIPVGLEDKWTTASGAFIYTSDSRFFELNPYPIPLHDRVEG